MLGALPAAIVLGIVGAIRDRPRWHAITALCIVGGTMALMFLPLLIRVLT